MKSPNGASGDRMGGLLDTAVAVGLGLPPLTPTWAPCGLLHPDYRNA